MIYVYFITYLLSLFPSRRSSACGCVYYIYVCICSVVYMCDYIVVICPSGVLCVLSGFEECW